MKDRNRTLIAGLVVVLLSLCLAGPAAAASIKISDGFTELVINDNSGVGLTADQNPLSGVVSFTGTLGTWTFMLASGQTTPYLGSAINPLMRFQVLANSAAPGTLTVAFSETDFVPGWVGYRAAAQSIAAIGGGITYSAWIDDANVLFGQDFNLASQAFGPGVSAPYEVSGMLPPLGGPYSLTQVITIAHSTNVIATSAASSSLTVPDGGWTVVLLGSVLVGFGLLRRRFTTS